MEMGTQDAPQNPHPTNETQNTKAKVGNCYNYSNQDKINSDTKKACLNTSKAAKNVGYQKPQYNLGGGKTLSSTQGKSKYTNQEVDMEAQKGNNTNRYLWGKSSVTIMQSQSLAQCANKTTKARVEANSLDLLTTCSIKTQVLDL